MKTKKGMALFLAILMIATNLVTIGTVANDTSSLSDNSEYQTLGTQISPITAAETDVSAADVTRMRTWINNNLINAGSNGTAPAYEISYNGTLLSESLSSWTFSNVRNTDVSENVESYTVTAANTSAGLTLRCEILFYTDYAACEWEVFASSSNASDVNVVTDFYAMKSEIDMPSETASPAATVHYNRGSMDQANAFKPFSDTVSVNSTQTFTADGGRPSYTYMPFFNFSWQNAGGAVLAIGWPAQWYFKYTRTAAQELSLEIKQETFSVQAGKISEDEAKTPKVFMMFYNSSNMIKGQNLYRRFTDEYNNENIRQLLASSATVEYDWMMRANTTNQISTFDKYAYYGLPFEMYWMDTGWYPIVNNDWVYTGNWSVDTSPFRFPNGLSEFMDYGKQNYGMDMLVWFEPERVMPGTELYSMTDYLLTPQNNTGGWHYGNEWRLFNYADDDALQWMQNRIYGIIEDEGIDVYRQDFNIAPLYFWQNGDTEGVDAGLTENKYIQNYMKFLEDMLDMFPDIMLDNCASGGRRIDHEMNMISGALWRCDDCYTTINEQLHNYGLSYWIGVHGTGTILTDEVSPTYDIRSRFGPSFTVSWSYQNASLDWGHLLTMLEQYKDVREYMVKDYYPLTPYDETQNVWFGWQYNDPDSSEGVVQMFRRPDNSQPNVNVKLYGLEPNTTYAVYDFDTDTYQFMTGSALMNTGLPLSSAEAGQSFLIKYMPLATYNTMVSASDSAGAIAVTDITIDQKTAAVTFNQPVQFEYLNAPKGVSSHWFFTSSSTTLADKVTVEKAYTTDNITWYFEAAGYLPYHAGALCLIEDNQVDSDGVISGLVSSDRRKSVQATSVSDTDSDLFAIPFTADDVTEDTPIPNTVPISVVDVTVTDPTTVEVTFNQAVTMNHECENGNKLHGHWFFADCADPNPGVNGSWQVNITSIQTEDNITWSFQAESTLPASGVLRVTENCRTGTGDADSLVQVVRSRISGDQLVANDPQGVDKFDVFAVPYSYNFMPVEVTDVTIVDDRTVNLTFNQAVTLDHECEQNHADNVHWYFSDSALPNPGVNGSWQINVSSVTTTDNVTWSFQAESALPSEGVLRVVENCKSVGGDADSYVKAVSASSTGVQLVATHPAGTEGFDVFAIGYTIPQAPLAVVKTEIIGDRTVALTFSETVTMSHACPAGGSAVAHWFFSDTALPNPGVGDSWQISVSSVTTEDNLTWYFTAAEDLPAEGVLRFSEMCYITQGDEGDFVNVTSIENGKKLPATHPGGIHGYDVFAVSYNVPLAVTEVKTVNSTTVDVTFSHPVTMTHDCQNEISTAAHWYFADVANPIPGVDGSWQIDVTSVTASADNRTWRFVAASALPETGVLRVTENCRGNGNGDEDSLVQTVKSLFDSTTLEATDPAGSTAFDVYAVAYAFPALGVVNVDLVSESTVALTFNEAVTMEHVCPAGGSAASHWFFADSPNPTPGTGDSWQIPVSTVTHSDDNKTWYFTAASDLPAEGLLRFSEMCYITQGDEDDCVNVTSLDTGRKLPATDPGGPNGYDVFAVSYNIPLQVTDVTKVNDTTVNVTFSHPVTMQHNCPGEIDVEASWYFADQPDPVPGVGGSWQVNVSSITTTDNKTFTFTAASALPETGLLRATENCYVSHGDDDKYIMFVTSLVTDEKLVANRPSSGFDVFVVSY